MRPAWTELRGRNVDPTWTSDSDEWPLGLLKYFVRERILSLIRVTNESRRGMVCLADERSRVHRLSELSHVERYPVSSSELGLTALLAFIGPLLALYANGS